MTSVIFNLSNLRNCLPVFFAIFFLAACNERKVHTVKIESEANQIIDVLGENGVRAYKQPTGEGNNKVFEIIVNGSEIKEAAAIQLMEDHCLGRPEPPEIEGGTMVTSVEVERAREQRRTKMNIESQLRKLPGATCVDVNFVMPEDRALTINPYPATASVLINYKTPTFGPTPQEIANSVARSVPALQPQNVNVVLVQKPLRPLPEDKAGTDITRIAIISGIGLLMLLGFAAIFFFLRKRQPLKALPEAESILEDGDENYVGQNRQLESRNNYDDE